MLWKHLRVHHTSLLSFFLWIRHITETHFSYHLFNTKTFSWQQWDCFCTKALLKWLSPEPEPEPFDNTTYKNLQHHLYNMYTFADVDVDLSKYRLPQPSSGRSSPGH
uniref:Uncharacterized protein n=1 Tax=Sinocyclocheilus grahami TaxID=75366 RepID=A0A672M2T1_SINGR